MPNDNQDLKPHRPPTSVQDIRPCCYEHSADIQRMSMMILCTLCGNKRCPHGTDCSLSCTNSNAPDQAGSRYGGLGV